MEKVLDVKLSFSDVYPLHFLHGCEATELFLGISFVSVTFSFAFYSMPMFLLPTYISYILNLDHLDILTHPTVVG